MTGPGSTEERLREAFDTVAGQVQPSPGAYRRAHVGWRQRERRRRLVLAVLAALVFTVADAIGLWALNHADVDSHVIFSGPTQVEDQPFGRIGQP